ncbi:hypothetical protein MLD38_037384 [Melastoma candidum]|uniref:Uncharacterized protein n=1 Tax=Melastoma candidum TaxID=119954 RepID=A0ACB9LNM1_9MYRT|nr:hypothetical protein MLD38_037384 [Melastoma candidum]
MEVEHEGIRRGGEVRATVEGRDRSPPLDVGEDMRRSRWIWKCLEDGARWRWFWVLECKGLLECKGPIQEWPK